LFDMSDARKFTVRLLTKLDEDASYSNILLDQALSRSQLTEQDKRFASALFYGVLERRYTLDAVIKAHLKNPNDKLSAEVRNILRIALYQMLYMDHVPDSAAVNESVSLAKKNRNPAISGFVNGLLRQFLREDKNLPKAKNASETLALEYSCPVPLVDKWLKEYGESVTKSMLSSSVGQAPVTVRVNTMRMPLEDVMSVLQKDGFGVERVDTVPDCLRICGSGIEQSSAYKAGLVHVQDVSCQLCCQALDAKTGDTVLDICSAPGGKAFTIAEIMRNNGSVLAFDLHENRVRLIRQGAERLGLSIISAQTNDGKVFSNKMPLADRILCDVPCSGLGVIRRKPEIKYKDLSEFDRLPQIQYDILNTSAGYLKVGGILVYSTCTLSKTENEQVTDRFLSEHPDYTKGTLPDVLGGEHRVTITPDRFGSDGFYIAIFTRLR